MEQEYFDDMLKLAEQLGAKDYDIIDIPLLIDDQRHEVLEGFVGDILYNK